MAEPRIWATLFDEDDAPTFDLSIEVDDGDVTFEVSKPGEDELISVDRDTFRDLMQLRQIAELKEIRKTLQALAKEQPHAR